MPHFVIARRLCAITCAMCIHIEYKIVCVCVCVCVCECVAKGLDQYYYVTWCVYLRILCIALGKVSLFRVYLLFISKELVQT